MVRLVPDIRGSDPGASGLLIECRGQTPEALEVPTGFLGTTCLLTHASLGRCPCIWGFCACVRLPCQHPFIAVHQGVLGGRRQCHSMLHTTVVATVHGHAHVHCLINPELAGIVHANPCRDGSSAVN